MQFPTPDELRAIADPAERVRTAGELAAAGRAAIPVRDDGIMELLRLAQMRPFEIARLAVIGNPQMTRFTKRAEGERAAVAVAAG